MIHKPCGICGEMESVDFMVRIDDDYYCVECDEKYQKEHENDRITKNNQVEQSGELQA